MRKTSIRQTESILKARFVGKCVVYTYYTGGKQKQIIEILDSIAIETIRSPYQLVLRFRNNDYSYKFELTDLEENLKIYGDS